MGEWIQIGIGGALKTQSKQVELSGCQTEIVTDGDKRRIFLGVARGGARSEDG